MNFTRMFFLVVTMFLSVTTIVSAQCSKNTKSSYRVIRTSVNNHTNTANDLVQLAARDHDLSTLVAAVKAAGLVETLQGKGPYTIFAPTNTAFEALPDGTLENLLKPENKADLVKILTYHVVPGRIEANDLNEGDLKSVEGSTISIELTGGAVKINDAIVTDANNRAVNGVIHIIDRVILP